MAENGFIRNERNEVVYYTIPLFENTKLTRHGFSTRIGGTSRGECAAMNFSFSKKDEPGRVRENFFRLSAALDIDPASLVVTRQVHGVRCRVVRKRDAGRLVVRGGAVAVADALITDQPGLTLVKHFADCVPIFLLDPVRRAVGLIHAGWRGTAAGVAGITVRAMTREYGVRPADVLAAVGPSIGPCCFEVGEEVAKFFDGRYAQAVDRTRGPRPYVDLWRCNRDDLTAAGVDPGHIVMAGLCTACDAQTFYSHRRDRGHTGSMVAVLALQ